MASEIAAIRDGGQPLPAIEQAYFEPRFGADFSRVRVHTDARAAAAASAVNAHAFTVGHDIVFGAGQYSPRTKEGKRLLAHEMTHVVQQQSIHDRNLAPVRQLPVQDSSPRVEITADDAKQQAVVEKPARIFSYVPGGRLQRQGIRRISDRGQLCGDFSDFLRFLSMEDLARANYIFPDMITCLCLGVTGVDLLPIPGIGTNPVVEAVDCGCNILTFFQELYKRGNRGGCYSRANLSTADEALLTILAGATLADCLSTPVGALLSGIIGGLLGIGGGTAGGPPGEAVGGIGGGISGAVVGDFVFDIVAEFTKNMIIQGSPLPVEQAEACERVVNWLGNFELPETPPLVGF